MHTSSVHQSTIPNQNPNSLFPTHTPTWDGSIGVRFLAAQGLLLLVSFLPSTYPLFAQSDGTLAHRPLESELRFSVGKEGRQLTIPVVVDGTELAFLLDTGCTSTCIDSDFFKDRSTKPIGLREIHSSNGISMLFTFSCNSISLGSHVLGENVEVLGADLSWIRNHTGDNVYGILGMDFLIHHLLFLDFDEGIVSFLPSNHEERLGQVPPIPLRYAGNCPHVAVKMQDEQIEPFLIDSGAEGTHLHRALFDELTQQSILVFRKTSQTLTVHGLAEEMEGVLDAFQFGRHTILRKVVVSSSSNSIGRDLLSRFQILFDFPRSQLFIRPGRAFDKPEGVATCGASFVFRDKRILLDFVRKGGPAAEAGLQVADELLSIDGKDIKQMDWFEIDQILSTTPGRRVAIQYLRQESVHLTEVVLKKR